MLWNRRSLTSRVQLLHLGFALNEAPLLAIAISYRLVVTIADLLAALTARLDGQRLGEHPS